jgi:hypothetical protein
MEIVRFLLPPIISLLIVTLAAAQEIPLLAHAGSQLLSLSQLARNLGELPASMGDTVTLRLPSGVLTLFNGSREALWFARGAEGPAEATLAAATLHHDGHWWVSTDLIPVLGGRISGRVLLLPGQARQLLADSATAASGSGYGTVMLANAVPALQLQQGPLSVLLVDLGLLGLAFPGQQEQIDSFLAAQAGTRPLYFVLTGSAEAVWDDGFTFRQDTLQFTARQEQQLVILEGDGQRVTPEQPVTGVILLPAGINLRSPLQVSWQETSGTITFRR